LLDDFARIHSINLSISHPRHEYRGFVKSSTGQNDLLGLLRDWCQQERRSLALTLHRVPQEVLARVLPPLNFSGTQAGFDIKTCRGRLRDTAAMQPASLSSVY
jgi:hypothetical protein